MDNPAEWLAVVDEIEKILHKRAERRGSEEEEEAYSVLRRRLIGHSEVKKRLPKFVLNSANLTAIWGVLRDHSTWQERRELVTNGFEPLRMWLERREDPIAGDGYLQNKPKDESMSTSEPDPRKVFIIHGRNIAARIAVEHFIKSLGLQPIDFDQLAADHGGTAFIGDIVRGGLGQAQGIVALFTPEEFAALRPDHRGDHDKPEEVQRWQARPNVIFEAGMAYGMAPTRTVLVTLGTDVALFSDLSGVHVVRLSNNVESRKRLRQKLIGVRCSVDLRDDSWTDPARSGDFEACIKPLQGVSLRDPFVGPLT